MPRECRACATAGLPTGAAWRRGGVMPWASSSNPFFEPLCAVSGGAVDRALILEEQRRTVGSDKANEASVKHRVEIAGKRRELRPQGVRLCIICPPKKGRKTSARGPDGRADAEAFRLRAPGARGPAGGLEALRGTRRAGRGAGSGRTGAHRELAQVARGQGAPIDHGPTACRRTLLIAPRRKR